MNTEAERAILGAILLHNETLTVAAARVQPSDFFHAHHAKIFTKMIALAHKGHVVDLVTLKEELGRSDELTGVGGPAYITSLVDGMPRSTNVEFYASIVRRRAQERVAMYACLATAKALAERPDDSEGAIEALRTAIDAPDQTGSEVSVSEPLPELLTRLTDLPAHEMALGDLIALGSIVMFHGQPRDGKTWIALEVALALALADCAFGLERLRAKTARRVLIVGNEDADRIVGHRLNLLLAGRGCFEPPANIHLIVGKGADLDEPAWQARLTRETLRLGVEFVFFDPLRSLTRCVDQGPAELAPFAQFARRFIRETGAGLGFVHHDTKPNPGAGVADPRRRAQRASGGAIFSIVDAPIHVERVDETRSLVAPDGFKLGPDPESFIVERLGSDAAGTMRLVAVATPGVSSPSDLVLRSRLADYLRDNPGSSGNNIARGVQGNKKHVLRTLEQMFEAGLVDAVDGARKARLWTLR